MTEGMDEVRNALVEAVAARKLIEDKIAHAKDELAQWQKRLEHKDQIAQENLDHEIANRIRQLQITIAELEADAMAQSDLEKQLRATLTRLEHSVPGAPLPDLSHVNDADETLEKLEGKLLESEAYAELAANDKDRELEEKTESAELDDQLEALKKAVKDREKK